jgi:ABC-type multidrug transport system ATPase subunit
MRGSYPRHAWLPRERLGADTLLDQRTHALSLGRRRRAFLAAALVGDPALPVLDEPTDGLEPDGVAMRGTLLRERPATGAIALVASHDLAFADTLGARRVRLSATRTAPSGA